MQSYFSSQSAPGGRGEPRVNRRGKVSNRMRQTFPVKGLIVNIFDFMRCVSVPTTRLCNPKAAMKKMELNRHGRVQYNLIYGNGAGWDQPFGPSRAVDDSC